MDQFTQTIADVIRLSQQIIDKVNQNPYELDMRCSSDALESMKKQRLNLIYLRGKISEENLELLDSADTKIDEAIMKLEEAICWQEKELYASN